MSLFLLPVSKKRPTTSEEFYTRAAKYVNAEDATGPWARLSTLGATAQKTIDPPTGKRVKKEKNSQRRAQITIRR